MYKNKKIVVATIIAMLFFAASYSVLAQTGDQMTSSRPDALASYRLGRDLENQGKNEDANTRYNEAVRICLDEIKSANATIDTYTVLTWTLNRQKKYNEVIVRGNEGLKIEIDYRIIETMGEAYFYLGNFPSSLQSMQRYTNALPQGDRASVAYFFMGEVYRYQKKFNYADIAYTTAVKLTPDSALWWFRLGLVREAAGNNQSALEAYNKALQVDPNYAQAKNAVANLRRT
ncbi:MAG: tetratricopeptide repeat protein [Termitinemataceae bacterium]|nr:MAG: tetratricopeptide repeat protein [Termitinemataceae bacterium]